MATDQNSDLYCQACGKDVSRGKITISSTGRIYCPGLNGAREFPSCFEVENLVLMPRGQIPRSTTPSYICRPADEIREMIAKNTVTQFGPLEESLNPLKKERQPLEVTAYECQTCGHLEKDLEKATAHAEIPLKSLPQGLIYSTVPGEQYEILVSASSVDHRHISHHQIDQIQVLSTRRYLRTGNAEDIMNDLREGKIQIFSEDEFAEFLDVNQEPLRELQNDFKIKEFVRTTPELDSLVVER